MTDINKYNLTPREIDVLKCITKGFNNEQIAQELEISIATVKAHASEIFLKFNVSDRTQAAIKSIREGLL